MSMLANIRGRFESTPYSSGRHDTARADTDVQLAMIKRLYRWAFAILLAGGGAVGLIALRTAIFVWRFHY
jgi:hypothetical protein